jgi:hypothetical protein
MQLPAPAPQVLGFALVFLAVVIGGALIGTVLAKLLQAVGLRRRRSNAGRAVRPRPRTAAGAGRRAARGTDGDPAAGLVAEFNSRAAFADAALALRPYLPADWASRLDYSAAGGKPAAPGSAVEPRGQRT